MSNTEFCTIDVTLPAAQINEAIQAASEPFIAFMHSAATCDDTYFAELASALREAPGCVFAQGALSFGKRAYLLPDTPQASACTYDAGVDYVKVSFQLAGALFSAQALRETGLTLSEDLHYCRDAAFMACVLAASPRWRYVPSCSYGLPKALNDSEVKSPNSHIKGWYTESTIPLLSALQAQCAGDVLPLCAQYALLFLTHQRLAANRGQAVKLVFDSMAEQGAYLAEMGEVFTHVCDEVLFRKAVASGQSTFEPLFIAKLRNGGTVPRLEPRVVEGGEIKLFFAHAAADTAPVVRLKSQRVTIQTLHLETRDGVEGLAMDVRVDFYFPLDSYTLWFENSGEDGSIEATPLEYTERLGDMVEIFNIEVMRYRSYRAFVPLHSGKQDIKLFVEVLGHKLRMDFDMLDVWQSRVFNNPVSYWSIPGRVVFWDNGILKVRPANRLRKMYRELRFLYHLKVSESVPECVYEWRKAYWKTLCRFKGRRIWCYYDKAYKAGDNGEYALRYAAAQDDGIEKVFFIEPDCPDGIRLAQQGYTVVEPGTAQATLYALHAEVVFMTHVPVFLKLGIGRKIIRYFKDIVNPKVIRMYHGFPITTSPTYTAMHSDAAGVVVSSTYERELYMNSDNAYPAEKIIECGNPRYDDLRNDDQRQIMIAPTWRPSLVGKNIGGGESGYNKAFKESYFFRAYNSIITDERLLATARKCGYRIALYMHPKLSAQTVDFEGNDVVVPINCAKDGISYVEMMSKSSLMVTDYSSVQFDFAYMRKPVVYLQDPALPYWRSVDFDAGRLGFGEVCTSPSELVDVLCAYMERDCELSDFYRARIDGFFLHSDGNSAKRLYEAVRKLVG